MKKVIFGIFAHPDDEAFGPGGTFIKEVADGSELHLITLTLGQNGTNPDNVADLSEIRRNEWLESGRLMGAASQHELGFTDGHLGNIEMLAATEKIQEIVRQTITDREVSVEFVCFDLNGLTGHIDHIVATRAACLAFYRLKEQGVAMTKIRLFCMSEAHVPAANTDWLYMEAGRNESEIDEIVDAREFYDQIIAVIRAHHSQSGDGETHIRNYGRELGRNHFIVLS